MLALARFGTPQRGNRFLLVRRRPFGVRRRLLLVAAGLASIQLDADDADAETEPQQDKERRQGRLAPAPAPRFFEWADRTGADRLAGEEALQVVGQLGGRGVALRRLLLETFQTDRLQVARRG